jgi:hypothetical protein
MTHPTAPSLAGLAPRGMEAVEAVANLWVGRFDNARQVEASLARGGAPTPELTREHRSMEVVRLNAPQLGEVVLYLQECRATVPQRAHRQRLMRLRVEDEGVLAEQLFFREGPTYDRPLLPAERVAGLAEEAFMRFPGCDLHFCFEPQFNRWRGSMAPGTCRYHHPEDGEVCAEFAMLLGGDQLWYRDRSLRLRDGSIRGEIDGFSWLLFDRRHRNDGPLGGPTLVAASLPAFTQQMGVWQGTFRRYSADGELQDCLASTVVQRLEAQDGRWLYSQTNVYQRPDGRHDRLDASGELLDGRLRFSTDRFDGWAMDVPDAPGTTVLVMESRDGSNLRVREISHLLEGGRRRVRSFQAFQGDHPVGYTHIDEAKRSDDWRDWTPPPGQTDG